MKMLSKLVVAATLVATMWVGPSFAYDRETRDIHNERPAQAQVFHRPVARGAHFQREPMVRWGHHIRPVFYRHVPHAQPYHRF